MQLSSIMKQRTNNINDSELSGTIKHTVAEYYMR